MGNPAKRWAVSPSGGDDGSARRGGSLLGGLFGVLGAKGKTEYELAMHREHNAIDTASYGEKKDFDTKSEVEINRSRFEHQHKYETEAQAERLKHLGVITGTNPDGTPKYDTHRQAGLRRVGDVEMQAMGLINRPGKGVEGEATEEGDDNTNTGSNTTSTPSGNGGGSGGNGGGSGGKGSGGSGGVTDVTPIPKNRAELIAKLEERAKANGNTPEEAQAFREKAEKLRHQREVVAPDNGNKADRNLNPSRTESNVKPTGGNAGANADLGNIQEAAAETVAEGTGVKPTKPKNPRGSGKSKPPKAEATDGGEDDFRINK